MDRAYNAGAKLEFGPCKQLFDNWARLAGHIKAYIPSSLNHYLAWSGSSDFLATKTDRMKTQRGDKYMNTCIHGDGSEVAGNQTVSVQEEGTAPVIREQWGNSGWEEFEASRAESATL